MIYALVTAFVANATLLDALSLATACICLLLMAAALSIGPLQARRAGAPPANIILRRDVGIWAAAAGLVHFMVATDLSMTPEYMSIYVDVSTGGLSRGLRAALFFWGSIAAFAVGILILLLLGLSNNGALRLLGVAWWKRLQRSAYLAFVLTVVHGLAFQILEARHPLLIGLLLILSLFVITLQIAGFVSITRARGQNT